MSSAPVSPKLSEDTPPESMPSAVGATRGAIAWSSFFFAVLQSICTFFLALGGLRLLIGIGSLALSAGAATFFERLHADWIRIPMILLALLGAFLNLAVLAQVRRLRNRPASRWRQVPLSLGKIRTERVQLVLSIVTIALVAIEEWLHIWEHHHI